MALTLTLPLGAAQEPDCSTRDDALGPAHTWTVRGCEGSVYFGATVTFPTGRIDIHWERDEGAGYTSLGLVMPPRYVAWREDAAGCTLDLGVVGGMRAACPVGPPAPPALLP